MDDDVAPLPSITSAFTRSSPDFGRRHDREIRTKISLAMSRSTANCENPI
jgi:hypothetical protein